jgi:Invasin, domain 3
MAVLAVLAMACAPALAQASEPIGSFTASVSSTQAGGHPDLSVSLALEEPGVTEVAKSATAGLPAGLTLIPSAVAQCTASSFALDECAIASQVGLVTIHADHEGDSDDLLGTAPVFALVPAEGGYGELGFIVPVTETHVTAPLSIRGASDYGLNTTIEGLEQSTPLVGLALTLWGFPASPEYDTDRFPRGSPGSPTGCPGLEGTGCLGERTASSLPIQPFTLNPTTCSSEHPAATLALETYADPEHPTHAQTGMPAATGCDQLSFNPLLTASPTTTEADSASGLELMIVNPLSLGRSVPTGSELRDATVTLPEEMELNSEALAGRAACTDAEAGLGSEEPGDCSDESLLGTASLELPSGSVSGFVYLGEPALDGSARLLLLVNGGGVDAKLVATLETDPVSEQLQLRLSDLPQLPVREYKIHLFGREGPFVTPPFCEAYEVKALFTPWDEALSPQIATQDFAIDSGPGGSPCPAPAEEIEVALSPAVVPADHNSVVTATATVTDANAIGVPGDEIVFSSTDPGQTIGPVEDDGDGTYTAKVVASAAPGVSTITATDESVEPALLAATQLTQLAPPQESQLPSPPPSSEPTPKVSLTRKPPHASRDARPKFRFRSDVPGSSFACRLDHHSFQPCDSPFTSPTLALGKHRFEVRASGPTGLVGSPASYEFTVLGSRFR